MLEIGKLLLGFGDCRMQALKLLFGLAAGTAYSGTVSP